MTPANCCPSSRAEPGAEKRRAASRNMRMMRKIWTKRAMKATG